MSLPNTGTFSYNGVAWTSLYKSKVELKPIKDSAGRALVEREYTIDVEGHVAAAPGSTTDGTLASYRKLLEQPAGALIYTGKGFGNLQVNVPGGLLWDSAYGPWPDVLAWDPVGNDQGCLVRWRCVTRVPCEENPTPQGITEYCWEETWDVDEDGYTVRVIEGHLTVQATRPKPTSRLIPDNADAYREQVVPDLPLGFQRKQNYKLSEDKRTLTFHFEDTEMPAPLPDGVTRADVKQVDRWSAPRPGQKHIMQSTISGTITLPARVPKRFAFDKIMLILKSRWLKGGLQAAVKLVAGGQGRVNFLYLLQNIEIEEEIFGRSCSFSASVFVSPSAPRIVDAIIIAPATLLQATGLWQPIKGTDFVRWKASIFQQAGSGKPQAPRGMAAMGFANLDDAIVDLCGRQRLLKANPVAAGIPKNLARGVPRQDNGADIDPDSSWLFYRSRIRLIEDDRVARHKPIGSNSKPTPVKPLDGSVVQAPNTSPGLQPPQPNEIGFKPQAAQENLDPQGPGYTSNTPDLLQQVSSPTYTVRLEGIAVRIGYEIPTPRLDRIGDVKVTQIRQNVSQEQISSLSGIPIFAATWVIDYALPNATDAELPMPVNPAVW